MKKNTLNFVEKGQISKVLKILKDCSIKRRLLDLGFTPGTLVEIVMRNYGGNLISCMVRLTLVAIRNEDAQMILVEVIK